MERILPNTLSARVREFFGLTQYDLAEYAGISRGQVQITKITALPTAVTAHKAIL